MRLYCDGAYSPKNKVGAYAVIEGADNVVRRRIVLGSNLSANICEMLGLIAALKFIKLEKGTVTVFSDSQYVVNSYTQWMEAWQRKGWKRGKKREPVKNLALVKVMYGFKKKYGKRVRVMWMPREGNEAADKAAKKMIKNYLKTHPKRVTG